jgi:hypothetical protein
MEIEKAKGEKPEIVGKARQAQLISQRGNGQVLVGVDLPWRGSIKVVAKQNGFFDQILALAELPASDRWPEILAVSRRSGIPSIWRRARPSLLENNAAALLTGLAFSNQRHWPRLIKSFFRDNNLTAGLRGRPTLHPGEVKDMRRGVQIDKLKAKLQEGFQIKLKAKRGGGYASDDGQLAKDLRNRGYGYREIETILKSKTIQDAACRLYWEIDDEKENVSLKGIRNSWARYKLLSRANPALQRAFPKHIRDSQ